MGQALTRLANEHNSINLAGGLIAANSTSNRPTDYPVHAQLADFPISDRTAVLIDFTEASATIARLHEAAEHNIPVVIGTTGFSPQQLEEIRTVSQRIPVLLSANMSLGINLLLDVVEILAARLSGYDIEVIETHHRLKKDAPSGTAIALANAAAAGRQVQLEDVARHGRQGMTGERISSEIGMHAIRGGDVVGDHTVLLAGLGERLEITHKASSRDTFAAGALFAAEFLATQPAGLYSMKDALKI
jgi:4-hydroxy-tetrahydrodipicolinate reductase